HKSIATRVPQAQQYFDQGLRLTYGFNHAEAIRSFIRAAELDPSCAMCWWGVAYAYGPHVNAGMDSASGVLAYQALQKAKALSRKAPRWQRAYIAALGKRYAPVPPANRAHLDSAYSKAMRAVASANPDDLDAITLAVESMMDLRPWNYWTPDGQPYPGSDLIVSQLESVIARHPEHPGACHYYIHAVEAVKPELALPCAERLARLMPGEGHMVHMPAHIYVRVGRYNDAAQSNVHAIHSDETFIEGQKQPTVYSLAYYPHNIHFLAFVSTLAGRSAQAIETAKALKSKINMDVAQGVGMLQEMVPYYALTLTTFGRWDDVIAEPLPPATMRFPTAMAYYARGVAHAAKGDFADARVALDSVISIDRAYPADGEFKSPISIAVHALMGEIATRSGDFDGGVTHFQEALKIENAGLYFEPPKWYYPIRQSLGAVLLKAGKNAEAEAVYRDDLKHFPENGWSLFGLAASLRAQGKTADASDVEKRFAKAWEGADVKLIASRF
ncbi:MAG: tetratricopeptide repeat protein, partial [Gemmatimonadota bacterium]|nr:tetratricopeptide repeat protein [Gemmatimonadota bacterium]